MTKLAIISLLFLCPLLSSNFNQFLEDFVEDRECSKISLSGNLFSFKNSDNVKSEIDNFQLYIFDEEDYLSKNDVSKIKNAVRKNNLELLNSIKSKGNLIEIYVNEKNGIISELFMIVKGDDSSVLFNATGKIRFEDFKNIDLDFDGSEELKNYKN
ncbi:DUF4252 domain-containing protein [Portibacter lacus]|uniref:DUF4252 domain-containing protein n=1 Tax=Portibacter lacus TaxID=1099794 RepID=A0AA37SN10_9BACT|nr:DUF4252 domain-containing protein [Portibacter lacus]GLR16354.1 hypothetical protein GCM10007940_09690 [Portibacter lacus]